MTLAVTTRDGRLTIPKELPGVPLTRSARYLRLLLFGLSGAGKTWFCKSFTEDERTRPVLWLDATGGTDGICDLESVRQHAEIRACSDMRSILRFTEWLRATPEHGFRTLVIDDFTESFGLTKTKLALDLHGKDADDIEGPEYAQLYERTRKVFRALKALASPDETGAGGLHVIVTCWPAEKEAEPGVTMLVPNFAGKFVREAPGYFSVVGYLEVDSRATRLARRFANKVTFSPNGRLLVKDRSSRLGAVMLLPTATRVMDAWLNTTTTTTNKEALSNDG